MKLKWFKKVDPWHECAGHELGKGWAKAVKSISPVTHRNGIDGQDYFDVCAKFHSHGQNESYFFEFPTEQEATAARKALVAWVKEVQS